MVQKNTLFSLLDGLSVKERKEFKKFLASPFFNVRKDVCLLFDFYLAGKPFLLPRIDKVLLFQHIYPDELFDDAKLRHLQSYLVGLIKDYLAQITFRTQSVRQKINLLDQLNQKGLYKLYDREWKKIADQLDVQTECSTDFYHQRFVLHRQKTELLFKQKRQGEMNQQKIADDLQVFFVTSILKQSYSVLMHQRMSATDEKFQLLDEVLKMVLDFQLLEIPLVAVHYYSALTLKDPANESNYTILKQLIQTHWQQLPFTELRTVHFSAINYCIQKLNSGNTKYVREAFDLYQSGLEKDVLLVDNFLSPFTYKNILKLGLELKEFDWIENYLTEYQAYLNPSDSENHYTYCRAVFYFNKLEYSKVLNLLQQVEFKDKLYELDARRMLLIIYYEQKEYDALESLLSSFRTYIHRQRNLGYHKDSYSNLIRFVKKFLKENLKDKTVCQNLQQEINNTKSLAGRRWLLELIS